jgi:hypothetical protein
MHRGGRGDARASCASPLGTPLAVGADILRSRHFAVGADILRSRHFAMDADILM